MKGSVYARPRGQRPLPTRTWDLGEATVPHTEFLHSLNLGSHFFSKFQDSASQYPSLQTFKISSTCLPKCTQDTPLLRLPDSQESLVNAATQELPAQLFLEPSGGPSLLSKEPQHSRLSLTLYCFWRHCSKLLGAELCPPHTPAWKPPSTAMAFGGGVSTGGD